MREVLVGVEDYVLSPLKVGVVGCGVVAQIGEIVSECFGAGEVECIDVARFRYLVFKHASQ